MSVDCVLLKQNGEIASASLPGEGRGKAAKPATVTPEYLMTKVYKKKKGEPPTLLGTYQWKQKILYLFGYDDGKEAVENQHQLPPPLEGAQFYEDILVIASQSPHGYNPPVPFTTTEYEAFYTAQMEGDIEEEEEVEGAEAAVPDGDDGEVANEDEDVDDTQEVDYNEEEQEEQEEQEEGWGDEEGEEAETPVLVPEKRKKATESKKKAAAAAVLPGFQALLSTDPECNPGDAPTHPCRKAVLQVIAQQMSSFLTAEQQMEFESLLFQTMLTLCEKRKLRKSWSTIGFKDLYLAHARTMIGNLAPQSYVQNTGLYQSFIGREITLQELVMKNSLELFPEHWQTLIDQQAKREQIQLEGDRTRATDRFHCKRCGKKETTYYELQTRSADEPMTIFINCLNCGKRWTQ